MLFYNYQRVLIFSFWTFCTMLRIFIKEEKFYFLLFVVNKSLQDTLISKAVFYLYYFFSQIFTE